MSKATVLACAVVSLLVAGGTATAANLVTSSDIKNGTIQSEDMKKGAVKNKNIKKSTIKIDRLDKSTQDKINQGGPAGPAGPAGPPGAPGAAAATEFGVASVFVSRGGAAPARWGTFSTPLGSPSTGTTTGGNFRFSCSAAQAPCKVSIGAAVISTSSTATLSFYPRLLIQKQDGGSAPMTYCEYVDGANNNLGVDTITRVPTLAAALTATKTPLTMGVGGTLDCGSTQPVTPTVTEIWVPAASNGTSTAFYDVWVSDGFGGILPEDNG